MIRITGTHFYTLPRCAHAVRLDLHEDRSKRREITPVEEFVRKRGRDFEDQLVAELGYPEPDFARGDWEAGAAATLALLREGVEGVSQGILLGDGMLGIPDLLRKEPGESALGAHHYVVGDVKTSGKPRSDQLLQVLFYSQLLGQLQERPPEYGYLVLKDGSEHRFCLREYQAVYRDVEARLRELAEPETPSRPFFGPGCSKCHWSEICLPELESADDLSLVQGVTQGLRQTLEREGVQTAAQLAGIKAEPLARKTHLEATLLRRLKKAARARVEGRYQLEKRGGNLDQSGAAILHQLYDPYSERMLYLGLRHPAGPEGELRHLLPASREEEWPAFLQLIAELPPSTCLLHYGNTLPQWMVERSRGVGMPAGLEERLVDLRKRLAAAALYPGPVFGLDDHVRFGLGADPARAGDAGAAAMWCADCEPAEAAEKLRQKATSDFEDLSQLVALVAEQGEEA